VFVELKRPDGGGSESASQKIIRERLEGMGFGCYICRSVDEIRKIVRKEGIPCRESDPVS
jgi:hypothetical protein